MDIIYVKIFLSSTFYSSQIRGLCDHLLGHLNSPSSDFKTTTIDHLTSEKPHVPTAALNLSLQILSNNDQVQPIPQNSLAVIQDPTSRSGSCRESRSAVNIAPEEASPTSAKVWRFNCSGFEKNFSKWWERFWKERKLHIWWRGRLRFWCGRVWRGRIFKRQFHDDEWKKLTKAGLLYSVTSRSVDLTSMCWKRGTISWWQWNHFCHLETEKVVSCYVRGLRWYVATWKVATTKLSTFVACSNGFRGVGHEIHETSGNKRYARDERQLSPTGNGSLHQENLAYFRSYNWRMAQGGKVHV